MSTSVEVAKVAIIDNLHLVFDEPDGSKRNRQIERLWSAPTDAVFVDPDRIWRGHNDISTCVEGLHTKFAGWRFKEIKPSGDILVHPEGGESDMRVARVRWSYGPPGEDPQVFGEDVMTVVDGKIKVLVALIEAPQ